IAAVCRRFQSPLPQGQEDDGVMTTTEESTATPAPGLVIVYTGHGKGKTTAALGLVFRALGRGTAVAVVQFIKGKWKTGECLRARPAHVSVVVTGRNAPAALLEAADTVTEMVKLKHPFDQGARAKLGIDY